MTHPTNKRGPQYGFTNSYICTSTMTITLAVFWGLASLLQTRWKQCALLNRREFLPDYTASHHRRLWSSQSPPSEPHIWLRIGWNSIPGRCTDLSLLQRDIPHPPHPSRPSLGRTQPPVKWVPCPFPRVKRPGRAVDHPPPLAPRLKKAYSYTSTPPLGLRRLQGTLRLRLTPE